ncbi:Heat shock protein DnaJ with tetratricopeptide repeat, putative isoform 1 [Cucumis melo var. makuwa]|uniref:Heat shock protein DnaJ with tetratricopeptide repeat, putative isoform 1 n=1 Tax=Cucumis melo var. makuwa TaxID=1194695 RepID=A0A5A7VQK3_CUCMM|nr:Heat shock protein DnaJ with tetratricopeptide repeat, putative isoform 1 [Cucumis melo var. makuwa]
MSPPAVELRSPVISPPPECSSATLLNTELEPHQFHSSFSFPAFSARDSQQGASTFPASDPSELDLKSTFNSQRPARSRPRLTKVRKRVASQHARWKLGSCEVSSNDEFLSFGDSLKFDSGFVFGGNRDENLNFGNRVSCDNVHKKLDRRKVENQVFVFGAKLSNSENSDNKCEQSSVNCENLLADDGGKKKAEWKWENCMNVEKLNSGGVEMKIDSVTTDAMNNNAESVSAAETIDLAATINAEEGELDESVGKAGADSCSNLKTENYDCLKKSFDSTFVFGDNWFDAKTNIESSVSDFGVKMKTESIAEVQKVESNSVNFSCEEGIDVFVFGSSSLNEVKKGRHWKGRPKTLFTLLDEMDNLNINDSGNIKALEKPECSNATFPETCSSFNCCDKPSVSSNGCLGNDTSISSEVPAGFTGRTSEDNPESSGKSKTEFQSGFESCSSAEPFNFMPGCFVSCNGCQSPQPCVNDTLHVQKASTSPSFSSADFQCQSNDNPQVHLDEVGKNDEHCPFDASNNLNASGEFRIPQWDPLSFKENLFLDLNRNSVSSIKSKQNKTKKKKVRGSLRQTKLQDKVSKDNGSFEINLDSPGSCTPMDFSPYQETISVDQHPRDMPGESSPLVNSSAPYTTNPTVCTNENDVLLTGRKVVDAHDGIWKYSKPSEGSFGHHENGISVHSFEGFDSRNERVCSSLQTEQCCSSGFASGPTANCRKTADSGEICGKSFTFSASSSIQASVSGTKSRQRKKNKKKSNHNTFVISPSPDIMFGQSYEFSSIASTSLHSEASSKLEAEGKLKQGHPFSTAIQETCEKWRLRGNQAYKNGELSKAEDLYTQGIGSVPHNEELASCLNSLMLCYSNRAATRMSLGKIRKALEDCGVATELDPNFLKVQVRAANCHLLLGETESALQYFSKCLQSRDGICLDRRMIIEAADGLQKAQKVAEYIRRSSELLEQKTDDAALSALDLIAEAISISVYSEKLLEMKAEALFLLQRYEEAIMLCEESLCHAEKNCIAESAIFKTDFSGCQSHSVARLWRWCLITKSLFYLGKFEAALETVGKIKQENFNQEKSRIKSLELSFALADTIQGLLCCKSAGNEAFRSGKYAEAVEHYTDALSINVESRSFTAVLLCNRAAAYQGLGQIADAIADCNLAIALDENYSKAFSRRANLHEMIRDYGQAASDLKKYIFIVENKSDDKVTSSKSAGRVELKKARRNKLLMEEAARKEISLDFYLILGVKATDTASDIKKAYRRAALKHHPDKAGQFLRGDSSHDGRLWRDISQDVYRDSDRLFKLIGEAYAALSDSSKRSHYDLEEEMRKVAKESNRGSNNRRSSNVYGSPFERSTNGRNYRYNWKSWGSSHSAWYDQHQYANL